MNTPPTDPPGAEPGPLQVPLASVLEFAPDAVVVTDPHGHIVFFNAQAERVFGWRRDEIVGMPIEVLVPERFRGEHVRHRAGYGAHPSVRPMGSGLELFARRRDGSEFAVEISLGPIGASGSTLVASTIRDITDRKRMAEEREQLIREQAARLEAEAANRLKDEFLSILSHELRTPLNAIVGWAQILKLGGTDEATAKRAVDAILRNSVMQTQLVSDILDLSRIGTGKIRLDVHPLWLSQVVEAALDTIRPAAQTKGVSIRTEMDSTAGPIAGDEDRLQQVIWNLLSNAVKFTPRGGRITVGVERTRNAEAVELTVTDDGVGIATEFLPHLFEPFRQADASTSRSHGGLGLGLAIVRQLVELHGGRVRAESAGAGTGARFIVELPIASEVEVADAGVGAEPSAGNATEFAELAAAPRLRGVRVLVVEDEPDSREMVRTLLGRVGAEVTTAASAAEGFERLRRERPDVLVADIGMPVEDGYSLMRRIRALPAGQGGTTSAIALTAHARADDRERALAAGFDYHAAKPVEPAALITLIAAASASRRAG